MDHFKPDHDPIYVDMSGCYITAAQLRFFLNREGGRQSFISGSSEFKDYFEGCKVYNLVSDMMLRDPECASMYWDEKMRSPVFTFPVNGKVARKFAKIGFISSEEGSSGIL